MSTLGGLKGWKPTEFYWRYEVCNEITNILDSNMKSQNALFVQVAIQNLENLRNLMRGRLENKTYHLLAL